MSSRPAKRRALCPRILVRLPALERPGQRAAQDPAEVAALDPLPFQERCEVEALGPEVDRGVHRLPVDHRRQRPGRHLAGHLPALLQRHLHRVERQLATREVRLRRGLPEHRVAVARPLEPAVERQVALAQDGVERTPAQAAVQAAGEAPGPEVARGREGGEVYALRVELDRGVERLRVQHRGERAGREAAGQPALRQLDPQRVDGELPLSQLGLEVALAQAHLGVARPVEPAFQRRLALRQQRGEVGAAQRAGERPVEPAGQVLPGEPRHAREVDPLRRQVDRRLERRLGQVGGLDAALHGTLRQADPQRVEREVAGGEPHAGRHVAQLGLRQAHPVGGELEVGVVGGERRRARAVARGGVLLAGGRAAGEDRLQGRDVEEGAVQVAGDGRALGARVVGELAGQPALRPAGVQVGEPEDRVLPGEPRLHAEVGRRLGGRDAGEGQELGRVLAREVERQVDALQRQRVADLPVELEVGAGQREAALDRERVGRPLGQQQRRADLEREARRPAPDLALAVELQAPEVVDGAGLGRVGRDRAGDVDRVLGVAVGDSAVGDRQRVDLRQARAGLAGGAVRVGVARVAAGVAARGGRPARLPLRVALERQLRPVEPQLGQDDAAVAPVGAEVDADPEVADVGEVARLRPGRVGDLDPARVEGDDPSEVEGDRPVDGHRPAELGAEVALGLALEGLRAEGDQRQEAAGREHDQDDEREQDQQDTSGHGRPSRAGQGRRAPLAVSGEN